MNNMIGYTCMLLIVLLCFTESTDCFTVINAAAVDVACINLETLKLIIIENRLVSWIETRQAKVHNVILDRFSFAVDFDLTSFGPTNNCPSSIAVDKLIHFLYLFASLLLVLPFTLYNSLVSYILELFEEDSCKFVRPEFAHMFDFSLKVNWIHIKFDVEVICNWGKRSSMDTETVSFLLSVALISPAARL